MTTETKEFLELDYQGQKKGLPKIDSLEELKIISKESLFKGLKKLALARIKSLNLLDNQQKSNSTKSGITQIKTKKQKSKPLDDLEISAILRFHAYGPPLSREVKQEKIAAYRKSVE
jgi:hypothetical protein